MNLHERIAAFERLGQRLNSLTGPERNLILQKANNENGWFTPDSVQQSFEGILQFLKEGELNRWTSLYPIHQATPKVVGVAMAGNIPLVGFHDFLSVLISGHQLLAKKSSQDSYLMGLLADWLIESEPRFREKIRFEERLNSAEAVIATGSDNTARYFEYYFRKIPHIIRKNRSSCAVLMGEENSQVLTALGKDVFTYFGLGCRNVSKLFVPEEYDFSNLLKSFSPYQSIIHHHKYANNYDYQKSILLVNGGSFLDNGFLLVTANPGLVSPISVLFYQTYRDQQDLQGHLQQQQEKLQCIVSANGWYPGSIPFGQAQLPAVDDYADRIDTLKFLTELN